MDPVTRPRGVQHVFRVESTQRLTPHLVRVHFGGEGVERFISAAEPFKLALTDRYVKLYFASSRLALEPPYDMDSLRNIFPVADLPSSRTYTLRLVDAAAGSVAIDFVIHGNEGVAGPWAAHASPGDLMAVSGPGGAYSPRKEPGVTHLLLGDASALPAIAATLEALPDEAAGLAIIEVAGAADEIPALHPGIQMQWLHRSALGSTPGEALADAVAGMLPMETAVDAFAHGERAAMKRIRALLSERWGIRREAMSLSAYWALGREEQTFQAEKRTPIGEV